MYSKIIIIIFTSIKINKAYVILFFSVIFYSIKKMTIISFKMLSTSIFRLSPIFCLLIHLNESPFTIVVRYGIHIFELFLVEHALLLQDFNMLSFQTSLFDKNLFCPLD